MRVYKYFHLFRRLPKSLKERVEELVELIEKVEIFETECYPLF